QDGKQAEANKNGVIKGQHNDAHQNLQHRKHDIDQQLGGAEHGARRNQVEHRLRAQRQRQADEAREHGVENDVADSGALGIEQASEALPRGGWRQASRSV
nr:hypothetical protein [Tanacetum cinerariifolium]